MIDGRPSKTAEQVALRRAVHQLVDRPLVLDDPFAVPIVGLARAEAAAAQDPGGLSPPVAAFVRAFMAARSRFAEDELRAAMTRGVRQYVVLGAGLDTFAYRQSYGADTLRVFELDHPATQAWKLTRLADAAVTVPDNVTHVPIDFEREALPFALARGGVHAGEPAFFSWLGVTMYLERDSIFRTLADIRRAADGGGGVVFDYVADWSQAGPVVRWHLDRVAERVRNAGEPWLSVFTPDSLVAEVSAVGFAAVDNIGASELNDRYFTGRTDGLAVASRSNLIRALA